MVVKVHLDKLDFLRGIAILLVFSFHAYLGIFPGIGNIPYNGFFIDYSNNQTRILYNAMPFLYGWSGVELFLMISGFLIHYGYLTNEQSFRWSVFFNKRFWRVYPPYIIVLILVTFLSESSIGWNDIFSHVFLVHNLSDTTFYTINPSFWSLALEAQLYLLYPLFLFIRKKLGTDKTICLVGALFLLFLTGQAIFNVKSPVYITFALNFWIVWVLGAFIAEQYLKGAQKVKVKVWHLILVYFLILFFRFTVIYPYCSILLVTVFHFLLMQWFIYSPAGISRYFPKKVYRFIVFTGIISYSIYLFHQPVLIYVFEHAAFSIFKDHYLLSKLFIAGIAFLLILFISSIFYKLVEKTSVMFGNLINNKFLLFPGITGGHGKANMKTESLPLPPGQ